MGIVKLIEGLGTLAKAVVLILVWVLLDGVVIRLLVAILRGLGPFAAVFGDNAVARWLVGLPNSPMPLTSYIWTLVGVWVVVGLAVLAVVRIAVWAAKNPQPAHRVFGALGAILVALTSSFQGFWRQRQVRRQIINDLAGPPEPGRYLRIGPWRIQIGGRR